MNHLTVNQPNQQGLTPEGKESFIQAYQSISIFEAIQPDLRFPAESSKVYQGIACLRMKDWQSTSRWNAAADVTGLLGELAVQRYFGISADQAMADFLQGLSGDKGYDLLTGSERVDVKSTRGQALKFKFSKTNQHRDKATTYAFVKVEEVGAEAWTTILGFAFRHQIKQFLRDDGRSLFVRAETLRREGVLYPIEALKETTDWR